MKLGPLLLAAGSLAAGVYAYQKLKHKEEPLTPADDDDIVVDEWVAALPDMTSARLQVWQSVTQGHFYGRWAQFAEDGETVIDHGSTPARPGIDAVVADLEALYQQSTTEPGGHGQSPTTFSR